MEPFEPSFKTSITAGEFCVGRDQLGLLAQQLCLFGLCGLDPAQFCPKSVVFLLELQGSLLQLGAINLQLGICGGQIFFGTLESLHLTLHQLALHRVLDAILDSGDIKTGAFCCACGARFGSRSSALGNTIEGLLDVLHVPFLCGLPYLLRRKRLLYRALFIIGHGALSQRADQPISGDFLWVL